MRIGLDITQTLKRNGRGIARYIRCVTPDLIQAAPSIDWILCIRGSHWLRRGMISEWVSPARRSWLPVSSLLTTSGLDLFHSFGNHLPAASSVPRTFTLHDLRALDRSQEEGLSGNRLRRNIRRAAGILCLTEHGKSRLIQHCPETSEKVVTVVPHGVDHAHFSPQPDSTQSRIREQYRIPGPFLLQLGSWFPHKNLELSIKALAQSRALKEGLVLVFVGGGAPPAYRSELTSLAQSLGVSNSVHWIDSVPGADLPGLLSAAKCLLQPSRYEGFALPILEAMAVGIPGVVSNSSCLPEVSGGIWPVVPPDDAAGFSTAMDTMALDDSKRTEVIAAGLLHAASFTWKKTAAATLGFFESVLSKASTPGVLR